MILAHPKEATIEVNEKYR